MFQKVVCLCGLRPRRQEKIDKEYCMSLRTAMVVFVKCRRSESKCFFRSYVFADCGHEDKRKCKSNIVCLCGLQWLCLLSVGDLKVNVSPGRMSLRTAATKTKRKSKSNIVLCWLRPRRQEKIEKEYCMSLRTAMICGHGDKEKI